MIKEPIKYTDYEGNEVTETFHFNLTKLEMVELEMDHGSNGLQSYVKKLMEESDGKTVYHLFKDILLSSVGKKSEDGRRFIKSPEIKSDFENSPALSELIFAFLQEPDRAIRFMKGVLPSDIGQAIKDEEVKQQLESMSKKDSDETPQVESKVDPEEKPEKAFDDYTEDELLNMPKEQFNTLLPPTPAEMSTFQMMVYMKRQSDES